MEISISASPRDSDRRKIYYHGTDDESKAASIIKNGLDPSATEIKYGKRKPVMRPVDNCVYITSKLSYAIIYALGGDMAGSKIPERWIEASRHGVVFELDGNALRDIAPDEDGVGFVVYAIMSKMSEATLRQYYAMQYDIEMMLNSSFRQDVSSLAAKCLTDKQYDAIRGYKGGEATTQTHVGKKFVKVMSDRLKLAFIDAGCHIAHTGKIGIKAAYSIDKMQSQRLEKDGSNFFELAKLVKV